MFGLKCGLQNKPLYTTRAFKRTSGTTQKRDDAKISYVNLTLDQPCCNRRKIKTRPPLQNNNKENRKAKLKKCYCNVSSEDLNSNWKDQNLQTEPYLEEILDKPIVSEQICQTDLFLERPITPPFVPVKYGIDIATEILPGDLFNFDIEVEPIIQNFVSKIMTVALLEIAQENEIQEITEKQKMFLELRDAEEIELKRLQERERRLYEEKERRKKQYDESLQETENIQNSLKKSLFTQKNMAHLLPNIVTETMELERTVSETVSENIQCDFIPWLMEGVHSQINNVILARDIVSQLIYDVTEKQHYYYNQITRTHNSVDTSEYCQFNDSQNENNIH